MKEIDFLPEWYKSGRRRQISYRRQYIALGCIFVLMVVWNFTTAHSVSKATATLAQEAARQSEAEGVSREFGRIKNEVTRCEKKANILGEIDSKIDVASVLAELSFLIDEKIVISKVEFIAEGIDGGRQKAKNEKRKAYSGVRNAQYNGGDTQLLGDVRFKVVISGMASDASDVAELICKLEDSPYFCQVYPSFSRNKKIKAVAGLGGENYWVNEFEIGCYLANYRQGVPARRGPAKHVR